MEKKEMYTMRELYEELEIPIAELGRRAKISDVTLAKIRDGNSARRSTINSLLRAFSEIYGVKLSLDNVSGVIIRDKIARQDQAPSAAVPTADEKPAAMPVEVSMPSATPIGASQNPIVERNTGGSPITDIPAELPPGTVKLIDFIDAHGLIQGSMSRWIRDGIRGEKIETTKIDRTNGPGVQHFFTPAQQEKALDFLRRHGKLKSAQSEQKEPAADEPAAWYLPESK